MDAKFTEEQWAQWKKIDKLVAEGHARHCACRQVYGKEKCSCKDEQK